MDKNKFISKVYKKESGVVDSAPYYTSPLICGTGKNSITHLLIGDTDYISEATGECAIALGKNSKAKASHSVALGVSTKALYSNSFAIGNDVVSLDGKNFNIGSGAGHYDVSKTKAKTQVSRGSNYNFVIGLNNAAWGNYLVGIGHANFLGCEYDASATESNYYLTKTGNIAASYVIGQSNKVNHSYCYVIGRNIETKAKYQVLLGERPSVNNETLFAVANNGTNLIHIDKNGLATLPMCLKSDIDAGNYNSLITKEWAEEKIGDSRLFSILLSGLYYTDINLTSTAFYDAPMQFWFSYSLPGSYKKYKNLESFYLLKSDHTLNVLDFEETRKYTGLTTGNYTDGYRKWTYSSQSFETAINKIIRDAWIKDENNEDVEYLEYIYQKSGAIYFAAPYSEDIRKGKTRGIKIRIYHDRSWQLFVDEKLSEGVYEYKDITEDFKNYKLCLFIKTLDVEWLIENDVNPLLDFGKKDYDIEGNQVSIKASLIQLFLRKINPKIDFFEQKIHALMSNKQYYHIPFSAKFLNYSYDEKGYSETPNLNTGILWQMRYNEDRSFYLGQEVSFYYRKNKNSNGFIQNFYPRFALEINDCDSIVYRGIGFNNAGEKIILRNLTNLLGYIGDKTVQVSFAVGQSFV